jgi:hypothetical protein
MAYSVPVPHHMAHPAHLAHSGVYYVHPEQVYFEQAPPPKKGKNIGAATDLLNKLNELFGRDLVTPKGQNRASIKASAFIRVPKNDENGNPAGYLTFQEVMTNLVCLGVKASKVDLLRSALEYQVSRASSADPVEAREAFGELSNVPICMCQLAGCCPMPNCNHCVRFCQMYVIEFSTWSYNVYIDGPVTPVSSEPSSLAGSTVDLPMIPISYSSEALAMLSVSNPMLTASNSSIGRHLHPDVLFASQGSQGRPLSVQQLFDSQSQISDVSSVSSEGALDIQPQQDQPLEVPFASTSNMNANSGFKPKRKPKSPEDWRKTKCRHDIKCHFLARILPNGDHMCDFYHPPEHITYRDELFARYNQTPNVKISAELAAESSSAPSEEPTPAPSAKTIITKGVATAKNKKIVGDTRIKPTRKGVCEYGNVCTIPNCLLAHVAKV